MLCHPCDIFTSGILRKEYSTWKRLNENEYAFKHGDHASISASAAAGCAVCELFRLVRLKGISGYESLGDKWLMKNAMVIVDADEPQYAFDLLSEGPNSSWISFELFRPLSQEETGRDSDIGPPLPCEVQHDPLSDHTVRLARDWIEQCQYHHQECLRRDKTSLPTRVIDVGYSDEAISPRLHINRNQLGKYVTLSHCWGSGKRLVTTKHSLKKFQNAIPYNQMPRTFQDAVKLTRLLGMRYLWIDALCIVQDDREDWRCESANMCSIYENAAFSIAALSATDSSSGILRSREIDQCIVSAGDMIFGVRPKLHSMEEALRDSKLESRAWCLQERILAPALLQVGPQQLFWECRSCAVSEAKRSTSLSEASSFTHIPTAGDRQLLLKLWYDLVKEYSARDLSKISDRLPAIAGLADKVRRELGGSPQYFNGLWIDDITTGLLWQRPARFTRETPTNSKEAENLSNLTPSWSWASIRGAVDYSWQVELKYHLPSPQDLIALLSEASSRALLQVEGLVKRGMCRLTSSTSSATIANAAFKPSGSSIVVESIACILDDIAEVVPSHCYCLVVSTWTSTPSQKTKNSKAASRVFYLVLERVYGFLGDSPQSSSKANSLGRFKRIGMGYDVAEKVAKVFANAERHNLELT